MDHKNRQSNEDFTLNADLLNRFRQLDDETLRRTLAQIAAAAGVNERQAERAVGNVSRIREQLMSMSEKDLQSLASHINPDTTQQIVKTLRSEGLL